MSEDNNALARYKQQLMYLTSQKQQLEVQENVLDTTIKELKKTSEKKVYKGIGNVFILSDKEEVIKDTNDLKDTINLKIQTLQKQEDTIIQKLNSLSKSSSDNGNDKGNVEGIA
jgi:prefoldin beta subunit